MPDDSLATRLARAWRVLREGVDPAGGAVDDDEALYRRLSGGRRDLTPVAQDRAREVSLYLWRSNPLARRLVELGVDFVVGEGLTLSAADPRVHALVDAFWTDRAMRLDLRHRDLVRELALTGELGLRLYAPTGAAGGPAPGRARLGYVAPERIARVEPDPENALVDATLVLRPRQAGEGELALPIARPEEADPSAGRLAGEALYFAVNRTVGAGRGTPDLLALADWIDGYDQLLWNVIDRSALQNAFVWDVTVSGADEAEIGRWLAAHGAAPRPGTVRAHNEKEAWAAVAPALGASEVETTSRLVKNLILGGAGLPEAWFADGDAANRATLVGQMAPTYKMLAARQRYVRYAFEDVLAWVVDTALAAGQLPTDVDPTVRVDMPEPSEADAAGIASALPELVPAIRGAMEGRLIDEANGRRLFLSVAGQLGVDLDPAAVEAALEEEVTQALAPRSAAPRRPPTDCRRGPEPVPRDRSCRHLPEA